MENNKKRANVFLLDTENLIIVAENILKKGNAGSGIMLAVIMTELRRRLGFREYVRISNKLLALN
jgi:hypothetical protein